MKKKINQWACYNRIWSWSSMSCEKHGPRASVTTRTSAFGLGFCLLSPSGHAFHTAWETMIKSYSMLHPFKTIFKRCREVDNPLVSLLLVGSPSHYNNMLWLREREREIKFIGLFENRGHRGPYSPYKPFNHNLYIGIIIFPHIDNPQYTGYDLPKKKTNKIINEKKWGPH